MSVIWSLTKRNIILYTRNKVGLFLSLLSVLIILFLFIIFLGDLQINAILTSQKAANVDLNQAEQSARIMVSSWLLAGLLVVNSMNIPMALLSRMSSDVDKNIFRDFLVSPIQRKQIILGYIFSACIIGFISTVFMYIVGLVYLILIGNSLPSIILLASIFIVIFLAVITNASFTFLIILFIKKENSVATLNSIIGTLIGFIAGVYIPMGDLSSSVQKLTLLFPQTHLTALLRQLLTYDPNSIVLKTVPMKDLIQYRMHYGIDLQLGDFFISPFLSGLYCIVLTLVFIILSIYILHKGNKR